MVRYLALLSTIFLAFAKPVDAPIDRIGVKGPLEFHKTTFQLAWSDKPKETYYIQEYLPAGENVEQFNQMLTIHLFITEIAVDDAVRQKLAELDKRKETDPTCRYEVNKSPDGAEAMVDFLLGETKGDKMSRMELNVYRYKRLDLGDGKHALLVYAYSNDSYGDDLTEFLNTLKEKRIEMMNAMIGSDMPTVTLSEK